MRVCCKYYSDLMLRARRFVAKVLQFKATVWPKVASESTYEAQKFQNFLGEHPPDPPSCFCISVLQSAKSWARPGYKATRKRSMPTLCPGIGCALATPLLTAALYSTVSFCLSHTICARIQKCKNRSNWKVPPNKKM